VTLMAAAYEHVCDRADLEIRNRRAPWDKLQQTNPH
jgi:hypothetical protein